MSLIAALIALQVAAIALLIWWSHWLLSSLHRRPTAIRIRFSPHGARRFRWRRFWRRLVDTNVNPGEVKPGTLVILDQNGAELVGATFDSQPTLGSSDQSIFTVAAGNTFNDLQVTGVAAGVATLTADGTSGGLQLTQGVATVTVVVTEVATSIDIRF